MIDRKTNFKKMFRVLFSLSAAAAIIGSSVSVSAATRSYDIIFRAGSHGTVNQMESQKVSVEYGTEIGQNPSRIGDTAINVEYEDGYWFTGWSPQVESKVTKKAAYVAQYKKIINGAGFRVNYVDANGVALATQKISTWEMGEEHTEQAVEIEGYAPDANEKTMKITNGTEITFVYQSTAQPTVETEVVTNNVTVPGPAAAVPETAAPADANPAAPADDTAPGAADDAVPGAADDTVTVQEPGAPLAANPNGNDENTDNGDTTTLEDENVPLANKDLSETPVWVYPVIGALAAAALGLGAFIFIKKRRAKS